MEFKDLKRGDILGKDGPEGELWNVEYVGENHVVIKNVVSLNDLTGWSKIDLYGRMTKGSKDPRPAADPPPLEPPP